jgi:hypothetical protein
MGGSVAATIRYAASDGVWKKYPCEVPHGTSFKAVYLAVEQIIEHRPQFLFQVVWPANKN